MVCDDSVAGSIVMLERLDVVIAKTVSCLHDETSDKAGGHRPKVYHDTFGSFLPIAYDQLVG